MTSKDIYDYLKTGKIQDLYKKVEKCFLVVDKWSEIMLRGSLLSEFELTVALTENTAVFSKLAVIVNVLDSYQNRIYDNSEASHYKTLETVRAQDTSVAKSNARESTSDIRDYIADFKGYLNAAQQNIVSIQSILKRLVIDKGNRGIAFTGDTSNLPPEVEEDDPEFS
jgi:hypothetical protein